MLRKEGSLSLDFQRHLRYNACNNPEFGEVCKTIIEGYVTDEQAMIREIREKLGVTPKILRPLWLDQAFFTEDVDSLRYHELCIYF